MMNALIETLRTRQQNEGWSDREMAARLGISHVNWWRIRTGKHGMGAQSILRSMAGFPEYGALAAIALQSSVSDSTHVASSQKQSLAPQDDSTMSTSVAADDKHDSEGRDAA